MSSILLVNGTVLSVAFLSWLDMVRDHTGREEESAKKRRKPAIKKLWGVIFLCCYLIMVVSLVVFALAFL
jgi:hypothetical protein